MKNPIFLIALAALTVASAVAFAADRYAALRTARSDREDGERDVEAANVLAAEHPSAFTRASAFGGALSSSALKTVVQETAASRSATVGFLSESERVLEKGRRERQVVIRLVNVGHRNLVLFLQDLESRCAGTRIREIHLHPSKDLGDTYEDSEVILSKALGPTEDTKP